jgi:hypothetical protein
LHPSIPKYTFTFATIAEYIVRENGGQQHQRRAVFSVTSLMKSSSSVSSTCSKPLCPKPEIQHNRRGRGMPTLTGEEVTIRKEEKMVLQLYQKGNYELKTTCEIDL